MKGLKFHHGIRDFLDETMILFDHIVQIFDLTDFYKTDNPASISNILIFSMPS